MFTVTSIYVVSYLHLLHNIYKSFTIMNSSFQIFLKLGYSQKLFNHFQKQHRRCSIKKDILKHFVIFTGKHLRMGLFFNKFAGHQACNFIKKRLQHSYFLANIGKFIRKPILKNINERLHCWKVFFENVFQIRSELSKRNYWWLASEKLLKFVKIE